MIGVNFATILIGAALPVKSMQTDLPEIPPGDETATVKSDAGTGHCDTAFDAALVAAGLAVYREQYCGYCHVLDTAGSAGAFGPTHNGMCTTAARRIRDASFSGSAFSAKGYILESIIDPLAYVVPGYERTRYRMPAYTNISEQELSALVTLLMQER